MNLRQRLSRLASLIGDQRGAVSSEYLILAAITFGIAVAVSGLGLALVSANERAEAVLRSNTP